MLDFFQIAAIPADQYHGFYDLRLVALSFLVAVFASFIALDFTGRLRDLSNTVSSHFLWLLGGSIAMGAGIWSMHFIGMLSFSIPGLNLEYNLFWTALSLLVAILASGFALYLLQSSRVRLEHYITGGIILGLAIASMHYTGMEGMLITLNVRYLPGLFSLSILIAIVASEAAIWLALKSNQVILRHRNRMKITSAIIMGIAICGMHYTGMASSIFTPLCTKTIVNASSELDPAVLSMVVAVITFVILSIAFFASSYKEALNQQQLERARQLGMAEISASVLHNVGNVLNSVNVSVNLIIEKNASSKLSGLEKLSELLNAHKNNLSDFLTKDSKGPQSIEFLHKLAEYWRDEKTNTTNELQYLSNNLKLIKEIISTQQDISKTNTFEIKILLNELLDEVLLITGLSPNKEIKVEKEYAKLQAFMVDKVKLLQVLMNLIRNAKDAVIISQKIDKKIKIKTYRDKDTIIIEISDNGIGIEPNHLNKIFNYGFTTKETGHGFGLHTSALTINTLGGKIQVTSDGLNKGACFTITLPYRI